MNIEEVKKYSEMGAEIDALEKSLEEAKNAVESDGRKPTDTERRDVLEIIGRIDALRSKRHEIYQNDGGPTRPDLKSSGGFTMKEIRKSGPYELRGAEDRKDYESLFGSKPDSYNKWTDEKIGYFEAVYSGRMHPGLQQRGMIEGIQSDGGFLVPTEYSRQIHAVALEDQIVMGRCLVQPMRSNEIKLPAMEIGDHSSNLYGGFIASYKAEAAELTKTSPKTRQMTLQAKKLTGLVKFSNELLADMVDEKKIMQICGSGLGWYRDKAFLKGSGAGEPLGVLKANCLLKQDKENGQDNGTILYENLVGMMSKMYSGSFKNSVWVCHQSTIPQLMQLSLQMGTAGAHIPILKESGGGFSMLTRPVIFTEKTEILGSEGDILLADFSQYVVGLRDGMRFDVSPHVYFTSDQALGRLIERHDGQPLWSKALTLEDGTTKVSPFVTLKARA